MFCQRDRQILINKLSSLQSYEVQIEKSIQKQPEKVKFFNKLKEENIKLVSKILENSDINKSKTEELSKEIDDLKAKYNNLLDIIEESGLKAKYDIKKGFFELQQEGSNYYKYAKAIYWTLLNYFQAYRVVSTDLTQKNINYDEKAKEKIIIDGLKKVGSYVSDLAKGVPVIGNILSCLD